MPAARHAALALLLAASGLGLPAVPDGRFSFDVYGTSWGDVYNYLTAITGKPVVVNGGPIKKCTVRTPPGSRYTPAEIVELINDHLLSDDREQKYYIDSAARKLIVVPADEVIDLRRWRLTPEEIEAKPRNIPTLVETVVRLKYADARAVADVLVEREPTIIVVAVGPKSSQAVILCGRLRDLQRVLPDVRRLDRPKPR